MTQQCSDKRERGSVILLAIFALVALLIVGGLATDAATLYHGRQALQKAADVGALAAVGYTMNRGWTNVQNDAAAAGVPIKDFLEQKAREATIANLAVNGFPHIPGRNPVTVIPEYDDTPPPDSMGQVQDLFTIEVTVTRPMNFLLIHFAPMQFLNLSSIGTQRELSAVAKSRRAIAHVSLILDLSFSMACPSTGACDCLTPARTGPCPTTGAKIDELIAAVRQFIKYFDYNNDKISIVPLGTSSLKTVPPITAGVQAFTLDDGAAIYNIYNPSTPAATTPAMTDTDIDKIVNQFRQPPYGPNGATNICDALMRSYHAMSTSISVNKKVSYVLFSDGAPTAGRFLFANPKGALAGWNPYGLGSHDYSVVDIDWRDNTTQGVGPSPLFKTNSLRPNYKPDDPVSPGALGGCGPVSNTPVDASTTPAAAAVRVFQPCLNDLSLTVPGGARTYGAGKAFQDWSQLYYDCAVQFTDFLREEGRGIVHVIGLGEPDPLTNATPYQTLGNPHLRKDIFNARLANDYLEAVINSPRVNGGVPWPEFGYSGYTTYADLNNTRGPGARGEYLATTTPTELEALFSQVAKKILLGLVA